MATSSESVQQTAVQMPEGVSATLAGRMLTVRGKLGEAKKNFDKVNVNLVLDGNKVNVTPFKIDKFGASHAGV